MDIPFLTITDISLNLAAKNIAVTNMHDYTTRKAARAIIFNQNNEIALVYTSKHGHHKLPGGGIDGNEDWLTALAREALEEAGCHVQIRPDFIGTIVEIRMQDKHTQTSYCGVADVIGRPQTPELTDSEIADGFTPPKWVSLEEALRLFEQDQPLTYLGHFMHARDFAFLKQAHALLNA